MIDTVLNLLFRCSHRRITRPITLVSKVGVPHGDTYVVCLDCGKQFTYDLTRMRIGQPVRSSESHGVLPPDMPRRRKSKLRLALWAAALPVAWIASSALKSRRPAQHRATKPPEPPGGSG